MKTTMGALLGLLVSIGACGGEQPASKTPDPSTSSAPVSTTTTASTAAPTTSAPSTTDTPAAPAEPAKPPPMKGAFTSFTRDASSGKVDKVGEKDGNFKGDGVKDLVLDVEFDGAPTAFFVITADASGAITGEFYADTLVGDQQIPQDLAMTLRSGKFTAGLAVYEGDKLLNGKDGGLSPLPEGHHKLALHVSSKNVPAKAAFKVYATLPDSTLVTGPVLAAK